MQKQAKQMIFVLALLAVFGAAYFGMRAYNARQEEKKSKEEEEQKIYITKEDAADITAFSYQNDADTLEFVRKNDTWISKNDESVPLNQTEIATILGVAVSLEADQTVEMEGSLSDYGFDSPENVITLTTEDGSVTLAVGMENTVTGQYYLTKSGEDTLYLVPESFLSSFGKTLEDLRDTSEDTEEILDTETGR